MLDSKKKWLIAFSVSLGGVMSSIDTFILYVATPNLRGVFSATIAEISAISTSYAVASMIFMLLSAWCVQQFGSKRVYQGGLVLFVLGSALCSAASSLEFLILSRVIQGMGAGLLLPVEGVILRRTFPPSQHGLVMGLYGTSIMCGPAFGPMLGGLIIDQFSWPLIFLVNIPVGLISLIMVNTFVQSNRDEETRRNLSLDVPGIALLATGVISLICLLERGERTFWFEDSGNTILVLLALFAWAMFFAHELMVERPLLDLSVLRHRAFSAANTLNFLAAFIITGTLFVLPIFMQELLLFSPTQAGTSMAPRAFVMMLAFPLVGWLFNRVPIRLLVTSGLLMGIASGAMMAQFNYETGWHDLILPQIVQGVGAAFVLGPVTTAALISIPRDKMAGASAIESTTRLLGSTIGIAFFASLVTHFELRTWEILRHNVTMGSTVLYKRFAGVVAFFSSETPSAAVALSKGYKALEGRVTVQVLSLTYKNLFQLITVGFIAMLILSLFISMQQKKAATSPA